MYKFKCLSDYYDQPTGKQLDEVLPNYLDFGQFHIRGTNENSEECKRLTLDHSKY